MIIDDGVVRSEHINREIDEARIKEAESNREIKLKELEYNEKKRKWDRLDDLFDFLPLILIFGFIGIFALGICIYNYIDDKNSMELSAQMQEQGLICAGSYSDYLRMNYKAAVAQIEACGFTNIETYDQNDAGLFDDDDTVSSISIDGDRYFDKSDYFEPNAKVIISYH